MGRRFILMGMIAKINIQMCVQPNTTSLPQPNQYNTSSLMKSELKAFDAKMEEDSKFERTRAWWPRCTRKDGFLSSLEPLFQKLNRIQSRRPFATIHFKAIWCDDGEVREQCLHFIWWRPTFLEKGLFRRKSRDSHASYAWWKRRRVVRLNWVCAYLHWLLE